ncbi:thymidylate kinase [Proteiniclasticum sp.]|uniref:thymidylate kinase n=1 Tax=Proteiniclasticum sp. TaxID=2053595 RepID=UPI0028977A67|nr:thymidylate kinase [Proteiniclasticum sp.]
MVNRLILVEGIPGAGKTTAAGKIRDQLIAMGEDAVLYEEGMLHPADMAWQAYLTEDEYDIFLSECLKSCKNAHIAITQQEIRRRIEAQLRREDDRIIIAYTRIDLQDPYLRSLIDDLASKEIYDGRRSINEFTEIHLKRWKRFKEEALKSEQISIFECAFLQNHITELLAVYDKNHDEIYEHLALLLETVKELDPVLVYIEPSDVKGAIDLAAEERRSPAGSEWDWIRMMEEWVSSSRYGRNRGLKGIEGVYAFCQERLEIDRQMIERLKIPTNFIRRNTESGRKK